MGNDTQDKDNDKDHKAKHFQIQIDRVHYSVTQETMTGEELRKLPDPDIGPDRDLFEVVPGRPDNKLDLHEQVEIVNGKRFFTAPGHINPGKRA